MNKRITFMILGVFLMLAFVRPVHAALEITEIMYDPSGTDTNREWVEIHNPDAQAVDLSQWSFWQGGTNHKIHTEDASTTPVISAEAYAILAHSDADFLLGEPQFGGLVFDSSFTLKNSGEEIELKSGDQVVDDVTFDPTIGADGDGNSLQKNASGIWVAGVPSPGAAFSGSVSIATPPSPLGGSATSSSGSAGSEAEAQEDDLPGSSSEVSSAPSQSDPNQIDLSDFPTAPQIFCKISAPAGWTAGVEGIISASATGLLKQPLQDAEYLWNFGDGTHASGVRVAHVYSDPGQYVVSLSVASGEYSAADRVVVTVSVPDVSIVSIGDGSSLTLENDSASELDLSGFVVASRGKSFTFPQGSFILPKTQLILGSETLSMPLYDDATLAYPNGVPLAAYHAASAEAQIVPTPAKASSAKKAKSSSKVLSVKVSAKAGEDSFDTSDASDTPPIVLSADDDGDLDGGTGLGKVVLLSLAGLGILCGAAFVLRKKLVSKPSLD